MDNFDLKKYLAEGKLSEGIWKMGSPNDIDKFIDTLEVIKDDYYAVVGSDTVMDGLDTAIQGAKDLLALKIGNVQAEGKLLKEELKAPSGWTEIKDLSDMHRSEEDDEIAVKAWDAPMEGWDEENKDIIVVRKEDDKFYLDGYIPFGSFDKQGPFDTYEEALKLAVEEMEAFKEDWGE